MPRNETQHTEPMDLSRDPERRTEEERRTDPRRATLGERRLASKRVITSLLRL